MLLLLLGFTLITVLLVYLFCPPPREYSGWITGVGFFGEKRSCWDDGPGWTVPQFFVFVPFIFSFVRSTYLHSHSSLPPCLLCFFVLFHSFCSHDQFSLEKFCTSSTLPVSILNGTSFQKRNFNNNNSNTVYSFYFNALPTYNFGSPAEIMDS